MKSVGLAVMVGWIAFAGLLQAQEPNSTSVYDTPEFGVAVRSYLLKNPEVLLEVFYLLEEKETQQKSELDADLISDNQEQLFGDQRDGTLGAQNGQKIFVEFFDYNCGYCRSNKPALINALRADPSVILILKEYPILGAVSEQAAKTALAIKVLYGNDAYVEFHEGLLNAKGQLSPVLINKLINDAGHSAEDLKKVATSPEITRHIADNRDLARKLKIAGTPSFVFRGGIHRGVISSDEIAQKLGQDLTSSGGDGGRVQLDR